MAKVFVAMPFTDDLWPVWQAIDRAARRTGSQAIRVDHLPQVENIHDAIWREIETSDALVADLTGQNANVAMEVHHARVHDKPLVLITQNAADLPFDLRVYRAIVYRNDEPGLEILEQRVADSLRGAAGLSGGSRVAEPGVLEAGVAFAKEAADAGLETLERILHAPSARTPASRGGPHLLNHIRQGIALEIEKLGLPSEAAIPHHIEDGVLVLEVLVRDRLYALINVWEAGPLGGPNGAVRMLLWLTPEYFVVPWASAKIRQVVAEDSGWSPVFAPPLDAGPEEFDEEWFPGGDEIRVIRIETVPIAGDDGLTGATRALATLVRGGAALARRLAEPARSAEIALEGLHAAGEEVRERPILPGQRLTPKQDLGRWNSWYYLQVEDATGTAIWVALDPVETRLCYGVQAEPSDEARRIACQCGGSDEVRGYPGGCLFEAHELDRATAADVRDSTLQVFRSFLNALVRGPTQR